MISALLFVGLVWRVWLGTRFYGWEESDYGNLAMVFGVLESGFTEHELDHMPLYYALGAMVMAVVGDASIAARLVSLAGGMAALGLAIALSDRVFGRRVAVLGGVLLIIQPEFALYSSSSLREPLYAALIMVCLLGLIHDRPWVAGAGAAAGFLVRFDALASLGLVLLIWPLMNRERWKHRALGLVPLTLVALLWTAYYYSKTGTFEFWAHAAQTNVDTGLGEEATSSGLWWTRGLTVAWTLVADLLPSRIGWGVFLGGVWLVVQHLWRRSESTRLWCLLAFSLVGCWAGIGMVAQHDPVHNLYWKWLCPFIPVVVPLGVAQILSWMDRLAPVGHVGAYALAGLLLFQAAWVSIVETERQVVRSEMLYQPQVELAQWIEQEVGEEMPVLVDNIPGRYLARQPRKGRLYNWLDLHDQGPNGALPLDGSEAAFARWLGESGAGYVFWPMEEWTGAPRVAPFLRPCGWPDPEETGQCAGAEGWSHGDFHLIEQDRDPYCGGQALESIGEVPYCWAFYRVDSTVP